MQKGDRKSWTNPHVLSWPDPYHFFTWEDKLLMIHKDSSKNYKWVQPFYSNHAQFNELTYVDNYYDAFHTSQLKNLVLIGAEVEYIEFKADLLKK